MMGVVIRRRRRRRSNHPQCVYMVGINFPEMILNKKSVIDQSGYFKFLMADRGGSLLKSSV